MADSYIELCLQALPPEKRAAARQAFTDVVEGAPDESVLSRLLIVFEATAAYGRTIPSEITAAVEKVLPLVDARLSTLAQTTSEDEARRLAQLRDLLASQLPAMAEALLADQHVAAIEGLRRTVERTERTVRRLRHLRLIVVIMLMVLAMFAGAGGVVLYFREDYVWGQRSLRHLQHLGSHGVHIGAGTDASGALVVRIEGPPSIRADWLRDFQKTTTGAELVYP
ncbi:MAG TPA: hypothetical protein VIO38_04680 [Rariglobus sp.]